MSPKLPVEETMDPGLDLAERLLKHLRLDLKRFARGKAADLEKSIGRGPRYLRRVSAKNLRLHEAFAAIRYLGFTPAEYFERVLRSKTAIPRGIPSFLRRRCPTERDTGMLRGLESFEAWARGVSIKDPAPSYCLDIELQLNRLGLEIGALDILNEAGSLFSIFGRHRPEIIDEESALTLIKSLVVISNALLEENHTSACCRVTDLGFRLEESVNDLRSRHGLFRLAARLCRRLGCGYDAVWCGNEAVILGLLTADLATVEEDWTWLGEEQPARAPRRTRTVDFAKVGLRDSVGAVAALVSERALSHYSAATLDQVLGAKNAFTGALNRSGPISVASWGRLLEKLDLAPELVVRRAALKQNPIGGGRFFQGLKEPGNSRAKYSFQSDLLAWAESVAVTPTGTKIYFPDMPVTAAPEETFPEAIAALEKLLSKPPEHLIEGQARLVCRELIRVSYYLRVKGLRNDSADFLDAAFGLLDRWEQSPLLSLAQRNGGYLAIELGHLEIGFDLSLRAAMVGVHLRDYQSVEKSLYVAGIAAMVSDEYEVAINFFTACWALPKDVKTLDPGVVSQALAACCIRSGNLMDAERWLSEAHPVEHWPKRWQSEHLALQAELLSRLGRKGRPLELLETAQHLLGPQGEPISRALLHLQKCQHLLGWGLSADAHLEARKLLGMANKIRNNPRGQKALFELCRSFSRNEAKLLDRQIEQARRCLRWPNRDRNVAGSGKWAPLKQRCA